MSPPKKYEGVAPALLDIKRTLLGLAVTGETLTFHVRTNADGSVEVWQAENPPGGPPQ